jgi:uncharacterized membrane protein YphA (DoxX/SURF4 family)
MKNKILTALSIVVGLMLVNSGLNKFFDYMPMEMAEDATAVINSFIASKWLWPLVAVVEIIGGILFVYPKTRALGAIALLPITIGILLFNLTWTPGTTPVAIVILAINIWAIIDERNKYTTLIKA